MRIVLNRECLETPLPHMTASAIATVMTANMSCQQPLHPPAQIHVAIGPQNEMDMIGHQTNSQYIQWQARTGFRNQTNKRLIIR
jgi:hypothetical protein